MKSSLDLPKKSFNWEDRMSNYPYYLLLFSMLLNFIVIINSINKPKAAIPVSFSGLSIVVQGLVMRVVAVNLT